MPAFLTAYFWDLSNAEFWVGVGLLIFIGILVLAKAPKMIAAALDAQTTKVQSELDEAARLRAEAEALLTQIRQEQEDAEVQAKAMLEAAKSDATRLAAEAEQKLAESIARREALAERRIAQAEAQATAEVKAAAADQAVAAAERILAARLASGDDGQIDQAIGQLGTRLN